MGFTPDELVKDLDRQSLETVCLCLLYKRESDGLNGRKWDAQKHILWEDRLSYQLRRFKYLGHISDPAFENHNKPVEPTATSCRPGCFGLDGAKIHEADCPNK